MRVVQLSVFARAWAVQPARFAWLLGAGASAAAGVPTAARVMDDLLVRMYAGDFNVVRQSIDADDPAILARIRAHYDGVNGLPKFGTPSDYSAVFEKAMPDEATRIAYLRQLFSECTPCYGQRVLGATITTGLTDLVLTTNFDSLIQMAATEAYASAGRVKRMLTVSGLQSTGRASTAISNSQWPALVKLHGDFQESKLKNLSSELQSQDQTYRQFVIDASRRFGLAVAGYSGRDQSVMDMLRIASEQPNAWPAGLWWLVRDPTHLSKSVLTVLDSASKAGVAVWVVHAENFDETMGMLADQADLEPSVRAYVNGLRPRGVVSDVPLPTGYTDDFPVLRLNALPIVSAPTRVLHVGVSPNITDKELRAKCMT